LISSAGFNNHFANPMYLCRHRMEGFQGLELLYVTFRPAV
jgi:hypothetical protein